MYNPASEQWIQGMEIPESRKRGSGGLSVYNNKFYLVGGNNIGHSGGYVPYFDEFNPQSGTWTELDDAPRARDHFQAAVIGDKLYAVGGRLTGGPEGLFEPQVPEVDVYDFNTSSWSTLDASSNLPNPRAGLGVVVFNNEIFTIAGETTFNRVDNGAVNIVESFNPTNGLWTTRNSLNFTRHGIQAIASGDGIHVAGGSEGGFPIRNMEFYDTDNPVGSPNVNSTFQPDETTKSFTYAEDDGTVTIDIILSNSLGTTGTYIDTIEISGVNFTLVESYDNRFLGANSNLTVSVILNDTTQDESNGLVTVTYNNNSTVDIILDGELDGTLSIPTATLDDNKLSIYPMPTTGIFSINKSVSTITIYSLSGRLVKQFKGAFNKGTSFDVSEINPNLYVVVVKDSNGKQSITKLLKK